MTDYQYEITSLPVDETLFYRRADMGQRLRFLVRYAQLAPSTYNSQPWLFRIQSPLQIWVYADPSRWMKIADADKRELYLSLGCAIENLLIAAEHYNFGYDIDYLPDRMLPDLVAVIRLKPSSKGEPGLKNAALLHAITQRRTDRRDYRKDPLQATHWALLESCCYDGVMMVTSRQSMRLRTKLTELTPLAYQVLYNDRAYRREHRRRVTLGQARSNPLWATVMAAKNLLVERNGTRLSNRDQRHIENAPGLIMLGADEDTIVSRVKAGQTLQHIALMATTLGISVQPFSQILEIPELSSELKAVVGRRRFEPMLICRLGYADKSPLRASSRRPLEDVLI